MVIARDRSWTTPPPVPRMVRVYVRSVGLGVENVKVVVAVPPGGGVTDIEPKLQVRSVEGETPTSASRTAELNPAMERTWSVKTASLVGDIRLRGGVALKLKSP